MSAPRSIPQQTSPAPELTDLDVPANPGEFLRLADSNEAGDLLVQGETEVHIDEGDGCPCVFRVPSRAWLWRPSGDVFEITSPATGSNVHVTAMNSGGSVTGALETLGSSEAFIWQPGGSVTVLTLPAYAIGQAINDEGKVVAKTTHADPAQVFVDGAVLAGVVPHGYVVPTLTNDGRVFGTGFLNGAAQVHGYTYVNGGSVIDLTPGIDPDTQWSTASGANDTDIAVIQIWGYDQGEAAAWNPTDGLTLIPYPPGALALIGTGFNEQGSVIGYSVFEDVDRRIPQTFFWNPSSGTQLLLPNSDVYSEPQGINDHDQVILRSGDRDYMNVTASVWSPTSGFTSIPGATLATNINSHGAVVGLTATNPYIWTPSTGLVDIELGPATFAYPEYLTYAGQVAGSYGDGKVWQTTVSSGGGTRPVTFSLLSVLGCNEDGPSRDQITDAAICSSGPDGIPSDRGEYFATVSFAGGPDIEVAAANDSRTPYGDLASSDIAPVEINFATATGFVSASASTADVNVRLVERDTQPDDGHPGNDNIDINPNDSQQDLLIHFDLNTGTWTIDGIGDANQSWSSGDGDLEHQNGQEGYAATLEFDIHAGDPSVGDSDLDGLLDNWERFGLETVDRRADRRVGANPAPLTELQRFPEWGAQVGIKDLYVEHDWVTRDGQAGHPLGGVPDFNQNTPMGPGVAQVSSLAEVARSFSLAPNPTALHIDAGPATDVRCTNWFATPQPDGFQETFPAHFCGENMGGGNEIDIDDFGFDSIPNGILDQSYYTLKSVGFSPNRRWAFRYVLYADPRADGEAINSRGKSANGEIGGNDIMLYDSAASTFMHELGHNVGLNHGGTSNPAANDNCKPNHLSVMNYLYQGIQNVNTSPSTMIDFSPARRLVNSQGDIIPRVQNHAPYTPGLPRLQHPLPLDEDNLTEQPIQPGVPEFQIRYAIDKRSETRRADRTADYNGNGFPSKTSSATGDSGVSANIDWFDGNSQPGCDHNNGGLAVLDTEDEWPRIEVRFRQFGDAADGPVRPANDDDLPTMQERAMLNLIAARADLELQLQPVTAPHVGQVDLTATVSVLSAADTNGIAFQPQIELQLGPGLALRTNDVPARTTIAGHPPACEQSAGTVTCIIDGEVTPTQTLTITIPLTTAGQGPSQVIGTATSLDNPLTNDPNPANNVVTVGIDTDPTPAGCTIIGTPGNDVLHGTNGPDIICGLGGTDTIEGGNGNDTIFGGNGDDILRGGNGDDTLDGGHGNDTIDGGNGNDTLSGHTGADDLRGNNGDDTLNGGGGDDTLTGGNGNDTLTGEADYDGGIGGNGNDSCATETRSQCER